MKRKIVIVAVILILTATLVVAAVSCEVAKNDECEIEEAGLFVVNGTELSAQVDRETDILEFDHMIQVSTGATLRVYGDSAHTDELDASKVKIELGENTFYLVVTSQDGTNSKEYVATVYRDTYIFAFTFDYAYDDILQESIVREGEQTELPQPNREGYVFLGWKSGDEIYDGGAYVVADCDMTFVAQWQLSRYSITYRGASDEEHANPEEYTILDEIELSPAVREGYVFLGWSTQSGYIEKIDKGSTGDLTLTAQWEPIEYTIVYELNGGENAESNPQSYTVESFDEQGRLALAEAVKKDVMISHTSLGGGAFKIEYNAYPFLGWYSEPQFVNKVESLDIQSGSVTLYAKWGDEPTAHISETEQIYTVDGDYILFGEYPRSLKAADVTINGGEDGYYIGSDGERYARVVASPYNSGYVFDDGSAIVSGVAYYFKIEPIKWRVLTREDGKMFLLSEGIIDSGAYQSSYYQEGDEFYTSSNGAPDGTYANNYKYSDVRAWLNDEFANAAFGEVLSEFVIDTEVNNGVNSTSANNPYICENTIDKVFLLSTKELTNEAYGFDDKSAQLDSARYMKTTDYSRAAGVFLAKGNIDDGYGYWWSRSPYRYSSGFAQMVNSSGSLSSSKEMKDALGIVPAIWLEI